MQNNLKKTAAAWALATAVGSTASAAELLVPEEYPSINAAIAAAQAGDTISVFYGNSQSANRLGFDATPKPLRIQFRDTSYFAFDRDSLIRLSGDVLQTRDSEGAGLGDLEVIGPGASRVIADFIGRIGTVDVGAGASLVMTQLARFNSRRNVAPEALFVDRDASVQLDYVAEGTVMQGGTLRALSTLPISARSSDAVLVAVQSTLDIDDARFEVNSNNQTTQQLRMIGGSGFFGSFVVENSLATVSDAMIIATGNGSSPAIRCTGGAQLDLVRCFISAGGIGVESGRDLATDGPGLTGSGDWFTDVEVGTSGRVTIVGETTITGSVINDGITVAQSGPFTITGQLTGSGSFVAESGGLNVAGGINGFESIQIESAGASLVTGGAVQGGTSLSLRNAHLRAPGGVSDIASVELGASSVELGGLEGAVLDTFTWDSGVRDGADAQPTLETLELRGPLRVEPTIGRSAIYTETLTVVGSTPSTPVSLRAGVRLYVGSASGVETLRASTIGQVVLAGCAADLTTTSANPDENAYLIPDGTVNGADLSVYVEEWLNFSYAADMTTTNTDPGDPEYGIPDGRTDGADLSYYVELWLAGCP